MADEGNSQRAGVIHEVKRGDAATFTLSDDQDNDSKEGDDQPMKPFPQKLMDVLSDESHSDIIAWCEHGNGFVIHKKKLFASEILPKYFKASKFTSFTRKLNRWGFNRVSRGPEAGAYHHKLFRRDKPELCSHMTSYSGSKLQSAPLQQQLFPNMAGAIGSSGYPGMTTMVPYMSTMVDTASLTPQQKHIMWQQHMQMMQMQMIQAMSQGMLMSPGMPVATQQSENPMIQKSTDDFGPLLSSAYDDNKDSTPVNGEGDLDTVHLPVKSEMV